MLEWGFRAQPLEAVEALAVSSVMVRVTRRMFVHGAFLLVPFHPYALHRVGHEPMAPDPTIRRYTGKVTAVGAPDAAGNVVSFESVPVGPRSFVPKPDELRTWRMTVLSGKRFGTEYRVGSNTDHQITVKPGNAGTLAGLAVNDVFVVESIDENGASMFATPQAAATPEKS